MEMDNQKLTAAFSALYKLSFHFQLFIIFPKDDGPNYLCIHMESQAAPSTQNSSATTQACWQHGPPQFWTLLFGSQHRMYSLLAVLSPSTGLSILDHYGSAELPTTPRQSSCEALTEGVGSV